MGDAQFFSDPEDARRWLEGKQAEVNMRIDATKHGLVGLFDELDEDGLDALMVLLSAIQNAGVNATAVAGFYHGFATHAKQARFGTCAGCGKNHDEELAAAAAPPAA